MATIKDISKACGVSTSTVSKALNGYGEISKETIELVKKTAKELNYMPNAAARQLKTNSSHNIGVLFVDETQSGLTHEYFSFILNSVKEEAEALGYDITFISQYIGGKRVSFLEHCKYRKCDGVVIACVNFESEMVQELVMSDVPVVTIDYVFNNTSCVLSDNVEGEYALTEELIKAGHSKIAFIHGERTTVTEKRIQGFYRALANHGIEIPDDYLVLGGYHDIKKTAAATSSLMDLSDPPTAILYSDDYACVGGMKELGKRGLSVPDDISIVGYDGIKLSQLTHPRLTTWYQDADMIGRLSARKLVETIQNRKTSVAEQIHVSGKLINGHSVRNWESK